MDTAVLLRLLVAHLLSDFVLQNDKICSGKQSKAKKKYKYQLLHSSIHAIMAYVLVADWRNWIIPLVIFVSHMLMDYVKVEYMKKDAASFIVDQLIHVFIIVVLWQILFGPDESYCQNILKTCLESKSLWTIVTSYLLILKPASVFLNLFIKRWASSETAEKSLPNAGKWIGYLERTLILTFMLSGNAEGVGFLLAAKSIFRFGELSKAQEIKTTEYVLIGTFASFTVAILVGYAALIIMQ